jgi:hypothetical protein
LPNKLSRDSKMAKRRLYILKAIIWEERNIFLYNIMLYMRKIYAVGISPSPGLISCKAVELIWKAPVVLIYDTDFPFELEEIIKNKRVIKLKPDFKDPNVIEENIRTLKSIDADWGVFLEIGDPSIRNPLFYHILGGSKDLEIEVVGGSHKYLIPTSALVGSELLLVADLLGRIIIMPITIPVGIILSFIGTPILIILAVVRMGGNAKSL